MQLFSEVREQIEDERKQGTQQDAGADGKGDGDVPATPGDVSGKVAERDAETAKQVDDHTSEDEQEAKADKEARETGHPFQITRPK